jgi:hypothetical protein
MLSRRKRRIRYLRRLNRYKWYCGERIACAYTVGNTLVVEYPMRARFLDPEAVVTILTGPYEPLESD